MTKHKQLQMNLRRKLGADNYSNVIPRNLYVHLHKDIVIKLSKCLLYEIAIKLGKSNDND